MIDKDKTYRTRSGNEVRIYATDGGGIETVHGAIKSVDGKWVATSWTDEGFWEKEYDPSRDLIEVRPRHKRTVWLHVFKNSTVCATEEAYYDITNRIACIKVELNFEEGEGL